MKRLLRDYSLLWFYLALWLALEITHAGLVRAVSLYPPHTEPWMLEWLETVFENYSSEAWQVGMFAAVTIVLIARGSPQSKDGDNRLRRMVEYLIMRAG